MIESIHAPTIYLTVIFGNIFNPLNAFFEHFQENEMISSEVDFAI